MNLLPKIFVTCILCRSDPLNVLLSNLFSPYNFAVPYILILLTRVSRNPPWLILQFLRNRPLDLLLNSFTSEIARKLNALEGQQLTKSIMKETSTVCKFAVQLTAPAGILFERISKCFLCITRMHVNLLSKVSWIIEIVLSLYVRFYERVDLEHLILK